mmetsp:Transcript_13054/g.24185  ORF Transcript_13054/g.24185 Transcript_13054/m.24185 type:complete len:284 (-) Transcript_13054:6-857(-)
MAQDGLRVALGLEGSQAQELMGSLKQLGSPQAAREYLAGLLPPTEETKRTTALVIAELFGKSAAPELDKVKVKSSSKPAPQKVKVAKDVKPKAKAQAGKSPTSVRKPAIQVFKFEDGAAPAIITGNEANSHELSVQNCIDCGYIYRAEQYAKMSRCAFCGEPMGKSQMKKLRQFEADAGASAATEHRDRLLEFDATSAARTKVYDDQSDYFEMDVGLVESRWASEDERAKAEEDLAKRNAALEEESRKRYVTFDIAGRRIVEDKSLEGTASRVYAFLASAMES